MLKSTLLRAGLVTVALGSILGGKAIADDRGSPEDQLACTPDVYRLCSNFVPDEGAIVACLNRNIRALTPACHRVMSRPAAPRAGNDEDDDD